MKTVIPVAGVGRRLRPLTLTMPKALVPVAGKPILGHILDELEALGIREVVLIVSPTGSAIPEYVTRTYPFRTKAVVQTEALGIGHAIYQTRSLLDEEPVLIVLGDTVYHADFSPLRNGWTFNALGVRAVEGDPRRYGLAEVEGDRVIRLVEKPDDPPSNLALAGIYYIAEPLRLIEAIEALIRSEVRTRGEYQLTDALQGMLEGGADIRTFHVEEWHDCGTPEQLLATNRRMLELRGGTAALEGSVVIPPVAIARDASVQASVIGPNVTISSGASIHRAVLSDAIVADGAYIEACCLEHSIVGPETRICGNPHHVNTGAGAEIVL